MDSAEPYEVVLRVGASGGSLALLGQRQAEGSWLFVRERDESFHEDLLGPDERQGVNFRGLSGVVSEFDDALELLNQYPWHKLFPIHVHPEFRRNVFEAVEKRFNLLGGRNDNLYEWKRECGID